MCLQKDQTCTTPLELPDLMPQARPDMQLHAQALIFAINNTIGDVMTATQPKELRMQPTLGNKSANALMQPKVGDDHLLKKIAKAVAEFMNSLPRML